jgi:hypothetical protein
VTQVWPTIIFSSLCTDVMLAVSTMQRNEPPGEPPGTKQCGRTLERLAP